MEKIKQCSRCKEIKPTFSFYKSVKGKHGLSYECKACAKIRNRELYLRDPIKKRQQKKKYRADNPVTYKQNQKKSALKRLYNLNRNQLDELRKNQEYKCKICLKPEQECTVGLVIDHCHKTNKIRGLLCTQCNTMLGMASDCIDTLNNAIIYLAISEAKKDQK